MKQKFVNTCCFEKSNLFISVSANFSFSESDGAEKKISRSQIRYSSKMKSFPQALSVSEDDFSELDSEHSPSSHEDLDFVQPSVSGT